MENNLLYFDDASGMFYLRSDDRNMLRIYGLRRMALPDGIAWGFPGSYPDGYIALKDFKTVFPDGRASQRALEQINYLKSVKAQLQDLTLINSHPYKFRATPFLHQLEILEHMLHFPRLAVLAHMGLGKTFISVNYCAMRKHDNPAFRAVVFAPRIVLRSWVHEIEKWTDLVPVLYRGTPKQRAGIRERMQHEPWDIVVTNYEAVVPRGKAEDFLFFHGLRKDCVIMDEGSRLKGHTSQRSKAVDHICNNVPHRYILSGALSLGNPLDVYMPFTILNPHIFGTNYHHFKNRYCTVSKYNRHMVTGYKNLDLLKSRMDPYVVSRSLDDCHDIRLPKRLIVDTAYELGLEQIKLYDKIVKYDEVEVGGKLIHVPLTILKINKLMQLLSGFLIISPQHDHPKCINCQHLVGCVEDMTYPWQRKCPMYDPANPVPCPEREYYRLKQNAKLELLEEELEALGDERCIIWANYQEDCANIRRLLEEKGIKYITPDTDGSDLIFESDSSYRVYTGQVSQGIGTTLNSARTMIYYSYSLGLEDWLQSLERNYRIGQDKRVMVRRFVAPETVERAVIRLLEAKENIKNFLQSRVECANCDSGVHCLERGIIPYGDGCKLADLRQDAERKRALRLRTIGDPEFEETEEFEHEEEISA